MTGSYYLSDQKLAFLCEQQFVLMLPPRFSFWRAQPVRLYNGIFWMDRGNWYKYHYLSIYSFWAVVHLLLDV